MNKNVVATITLDENKDVLLNKKCLRHSMNRTQSKDHWIENYDINKVSLSCFNNKRSKNNKKLRNAKKRS